MRKKFKFRFWKHNEMCNDFAGFNENLGINQMFDYCIENKYPVMQFTGKKDKKKAEVFEGDIVKVWHGQDHGYKDIGVIKWSKGEFHIEIKKGGNVRYTPNIYSSFVDSMQVIGNIYENPNLIPNE